MIVCAESFNPQPTQYSTSCYTGGSQYSCRHAEIQSSLCCGSLSQTTTRSREFLASIGRPTLTIVFS